MNQELILKILVGVISSLIMISLTYIFKRRQLYVAAENLYRNSGISNKGILCEISIFNRGRLIEEDIRVSLDNSLKYELVAFNDSNMTLENNVIKVARLHKKSKVSVLVLVENGDFSYKQILQVDSKTEKGKIIEKIEGVPPNLLDLILGLFLLLPFIGGSAWAGYIYSDTKNSDTNNTATADVEQVKLSEAEHKFVQNNIYYVSKKYKNLEKMGWMNLVLYEKSQMAKSYEGTEFPIRFLAKKEVGDNKTIYAFQLLNKTALPFSVSVDIANKSFMQETQNSIQYYSSVNNVEPLSKKILLTKPIDTKKFNELEFQINTKGTSYDKQEYIYGLIYKIE